MLRVVRVGGSLLTWDHLPAELHRWLASHSSACNVLVAGGGPWVEALRETAARFSMEEETAHWLSVQAMELTAKLLHSLMPEDVCFVTGFAELRSVISQPRPPRIVFDVGDFLRDVERDQPGIPLPRNWRVTSDSIAARVAIVLQADELVLLKSADPPHFTDVQQLAACGYVDTCFPVAADGLTVRFENLRECHHECSHPEPRSGCEKIVGVQASAGFVGRKAREKAR